MTRFPGRAGYRNWCRVPPRRWACRSRCGSTASPRSLAPEAALTAYRTVQEALTNVAKHAGRGARASIVLSWAAESLDISVADDGGDGAVAAGVPGGFGLAGMAERAALHGGHAGGRPLRRRLHGPARLPLHASLPGEPS